MRNRDTSAATAANIKRKHDRWIKELIDAGYFVQKTGKGRFLEHGYGKDLQVYATSGLGETYRVTGWTGAGEPILAGRDGDFVGLFDYAFTAGPR